mmetsp:Transcript_21346/g.24809  ORF Transcript_21346/g.24809 Transcript_21346/m.24809 type:complete len:125 (+) Transcript_21346:40-414(+)
MNSRKHELLNTYFSSLAKPAETIKSGKAEKATKGFDESYTKPVSKIVVEPSRKMNVPINAEEAERKLTEFDLNSDYGPALGISREARFKRAVKLGLNPPAEIGELLERKLVQDKGYFDQHYEYL